MNKSSIRYQIKLAIAIEMKTYLNRKLNVPTFLYEQYFIHFYTHIISEIVFCSFDIEKKKLHTI